MQELLTHQPATMAYIECDIDDDETLADFRKRTGPSRRRWWKLNRR